MESTITCTTVNKRVASAVQRTKMDHLERSVKTARITVDTASVNNAW